jgi:hypothetical protein
MSGSYNRARERRENPGAPRPSSPWVRATAPQADIDIRVISDRTETGGSITRLVDRRGKSLSPQPIVGEPGQEREVALIIAEMIAELLRRN